MVMELTCWNWYSVFLLLIKKEFLSQSEKGSLCRGGKEVLREALTGEDLVYIEIFDRSN